MKIKADRFNAVISERASYMNQKSRNEYKKFLKFPNRREADMFAMHISVAEELNSGHADFKSGN